MILSSPTVCLVFCVADLLRMHPAYQFVLLPLVACVLLLRADWAAVSRLSLHSPWVKGLYVLHLLLALTALGLNSPFLAGVSLLTSAMALAVAMGGLAGVQTAPWVFPALMLFLIPPPLSLDVALHQKLSGLASFLSEDLLDQMKIDHLIEGAVVVTADQSFFVDDACSGTNSLLITLCMAVIVCGFNRRRLLHTLMVFGSAGLMAVAANVLRIFVVIVGTVKYGLELEKGWPHEVLGIAFFVLDLVLVWSADSGWQFVLNFSERRASPSLIVTVVPGKQRPAWLVRMSSLVAASGLLLWLGPAVLAATRAEHHTGGGLSMLDTFECPPQLAGWERVGVGTQEDSVVGDLGVRNQVWLYRKGTAQVHLAVNFPFRGFHDTRLCYLGRGWRLDQEEDVPLAGGQERSVRHLGMTQLTEVSHGDVWLCVLREDGSLMKYDEKKPLNGVWERAISRWSAVDPDEMATTAVLQVMAVEQELGNDGQQAVNELIAAGVQHLAGRLSKGGGSEQKGTLQ
jgi:exosortase